MDIINRFLKKNPIDDTDICFCHNDLTFGNILQNDDIHFIDFEYAGYNYRHYEIANLFCEYMGLYLDPFKFPTNEETLAFINNYEGLDLKKILFYVDFSHVFWGLWAFYQHENSKIEFDYLDYCKKRIKLLKN